MERTTESQKFALGSLMPEFSLPATDGKSYGSSYLKGGKAGLVVFTCNHCPYVKGSEDLLVQIVKRFEMEGLRTIAISSNDASKYPEDAFDKMKEKSRKQNLPYPYLYDETQEIAKKFDAACTPECYLFDNKGRLMFHGAITDKPKEGGFNRKDYLSPAIFEVIEGNEPDPSFVHPMGCSIKWK